jgi:hypothetical protein
MSNFSREETRERLARPTGTVALSLKQDFQGSRAVNGLASSAAHFLNEAIECLLAGLDGPAGELLHKAQHWLQTAIETREVPRRYVPDRTEQERYAHLALCNWLLRNRHDRESLEQAVVHIERELGAVPNRHLRGALVWAFQVYLEAGEYSRIIRLCEQHDFFPLPTDLASCDIGQDTGTMCRILAHHRLGLGYPEEYVTTALNFFLPPAIESMFAYLQFDLIARWMKVIHWRGESTPPSAADAVLRCLLYAAG